MRQDISALIVKLKSESGKRRRNIVAYRGGEKGTELELFQTHRAGISAKKQNEGHEGDVGNILAGFSHQLATILQTFFLCQRGPGSI